MEVKISKNGNNQIIVGTSEANPSVTIWFDSSDNQFVKSDIKSELSAIAVAEIVCDILQVYVDIHSRHESK